MADFSFLSDTDDSAVDELLSQTHDLSVLEQLSAINCSAFSDSDLPSDLESRFRKLKSFPAAKSEARPGFDSKNRSNRSAGGNLGDDFAVFSKLSPKEELGFSPKSHSQRLPEFSPPPTDNQKRNGSSRAKSKSTYVSSPSNSSTSSAEIDEISSPAIITKKESKIPSKTNSESKSFASLPQSPPSPPRKTGCFWCSPKKTPEKKIGSNRFLESDLGWGKNNDFPSDLSIFSAKEQQKILKKAMKEEEKINREAEKIVKWAKQASARMNISDIEDELSDQEIKK